MPEPSGTERGVLTTPCRLVKHHLAEQDEHEDRQMEFDGVVNPIKKKAPGPPLGPGERDGEAEEPSADDELEHGQKEKAET
eukprot:4675684-Alexandrium_andersonii.AAC.1